MPATTGFGDGSPRERLSFMAALCVSALPLLRSFDPTAVTGRANRVYLE